VLLLNSVSCKGDWREAERERERERERDFGHVGIPRADGE